MRIYAKEITIGSNLKDTEAVSGTKMSFPKKKGKKHSQVCAQNDNSWAD